MRLSRMIYCQEDTMYEDSCHVANEKYELAANYCVDDLPAAYIPATRLNKILECFQKSLPLSKFALNYLEIQGLLALLHHAKGASTYDEFHQSAKVEQLQRKQNAEILRATKEREQQEREATRNAQIKQAQEKAEAERQALERDPKYIAKIRNQELRARYGLDDFIERDCFAPLLSILKRIDVGKRLFEEEIIWLSTDGEKYFTNNLKAAHHKIEAEFYDARFKESKDIWMAINASSHYRKCDKAKVADELLNTINIEAKKSPKLRSAFFTTHGGVKRDLDRKDEAIRFGEKAHELMDNDFRPCTLIGAVYMETGRFSLGQQWYCKAIERGASERAIDSELRRIFMRADNARKEAMRIHLLQVDPERYRWTKKQVQHNLESGALRS